MTIIEISTLSNGSHRNQTTSGVMTPPDGWAIIPTDMTTENFPFGEVEVAQTEIEGMGLVSVVTKWIPGTIPEPEPEPEPEPSQLDVIEAQVTYTAMMTDTLLEV